MMIFQLELGRSVLESLGRPLTLDVGLLCKNKKQKGSAGARPLPPMPKLVLFSGRKDQLLRERVFLCVPFTDGVVLYL